MNDMSFPQEERHFSIKLIFHCHRCGVEADQETVQRDWLTPYNVYDGPNATLQTQLCPKCAKYHLRFILKNIRIGRISQFFSPGYSWCGKCKTTWNLVDEHTTYYSAHSGCFSMCEKCWRETEPTDRLPFYREWWDEAQKYPNPNRISWEGLKEIVLAENAPSPSQ